MSSEFVIYYEKKDNGTYIGSVYLGKKDIESFYGVSKKRFDSILADYPDAIVVNILDNFIKKEK